MKHSPPTLCFLISELQDNYQSIVWQAFDRSLMEAGWGSVWFPTRSLDSPFGVEREHNTLLNLVRRGRPSAIVAAGGCLTGFIGEADYREIIDALPAVPFINLSFPLKGRSSVVMDHRQGAGELVAHLVEVHHCRRIGFLRGPKGHWEAEERFQGFLQAMEGQGLPVDPALVLEGNFQYSSGCVAMEAFLDREIPVFDALVCCNDEMALGACSVLTSRGFKVPDQVKLVGFDDVLEAYAAPVPLTTIAQPYDGFVRQAFEAIRQQWAQPAKKGGSYRCSHRLKIRQSCGCGWSLPEPPGQQESMPSLSWAKELDELLEEYATTPTGERGEVFLRRWEEVCRILAERQPGPTPVLVPMRQLLSSVSWRGLDALRCEATLLASEVYHRASLRLGVQEERLRRELQNGINTVVRATNLDELLTVLARVLPLLGLRSFFLSLHMTPETVSGRLDLEGAPTARLMLAVEGGAVVPEAAGLVFPSGDLVPREVLDIWSGHGRSFIVLPLFLGKSHFGFLVVEFLVKSEALYEALRTTISTALGVVNSLESQRLTAEQLKGLVLFDDLTGLYNRRGFLTLAPSQLALVRDRSRPFLVIYLDLDDLKVINDRWGHQEGDWALREAANALRTVFRKTDLVCRMGGDEFTVLALDAGASELAAVEDRLALCLHALNLKSGKPYALSLSLGSFCGETDDQDRTLDQMLNLADRSLYENKKQRKSRRKGEAVS